MKIFNYLIIQFFAILINNQINAQDFAKVDQFNNNTFTISRSCRLSLYLYQYQETDPVKRYRKMKAGGIVLTTVGTAATIAGGLLIKKDNNLGTANPNRKDRSMNYGFGIGLVAVGVPAVLSGVPMWIIGDRKLKKNRGAVSIQTSPVSTSLVYTF